VEGSASSALRFVATAPPVIALMCQVDSSSLLDARMYRLFLFTFDAMNSRLRFHGVTIWVRAKLDSVMFLVCGTLLSFLFCFFFFVFFLLDLGTP
jgi:hypothetical protein